MECTIVDCQMKFSFNQIIKRIFHLNDPDIPPDFKAIARYLSQTERLIFTILLPEHITLFQELEKSKNIFSFEHVCIIVDRRTKNTLDNLTVFLYNCLKIKKLHIDCTIVSLKDYFHNILRNIEIISYCKHISYVGFIYIRIEDYDFESYLEFDKEHKKLPENFYNRFDKYMITFNPQSLYLTSGS